MVSCARGVTEVHLLFPACRSTRARSSSAFRTVFTFRADRSLWIRLRPCSWLYVCLLHMWLHLHHLYPHPQSQHWPACHTLGSQIEKSSHQGGEMKVEMEERSWTPSTSKKKKTLFSASTSASALPCVRACVWWKKGRRRSCASCTWMGLWRNLPVRSQQREEEPPECRSPDKGDINTLTLDLWSLGRRGRRESESRGLRGGVFCRIRRAHVFVSCAHWCVRDVCVGAATPTRCCVDD